MTLDYLSGRIDDEKLSPEVNRRIGDDVINAIETTPQLNANPHIPADIIVKIVKGEYEFDCRNYTNFEKLTGHPLSHYIEKPATGSGDGLSDMDNKIIGLLKAVPEDQKESLYDVFVAVLKAQGLSQSE